MYEHNPLPSSFVDTHCHIDLIMEKGISFEEIEHGLLESNVQTVIQIAADPAVMENSIKLCHEKSAKVQYYYTLGLHPNEAHELNIQLGIDIINKYHQDSRFAGVGEIGLDFFHGEEHRVIQIETFEKFLDAAAQYRKPVVVHTRNAHEDSVHILRKYAEKIPVLIHCFTGNKSQIKDYLDLGAYISFSGIITFKNAQDIRDAALLCPLDRMVVETDAPFLAPIPNRGQVNRPSWVKYVAEYLSALHNQDLTLKLYKNSCRFFNLPEV